MIDQATHDATTDSLPRLLLVFVMPIGIENIGWKMYMINGGWDIITLVLIAVYWVETKGRTLEEIDELFEGKKHSDVPDVELVRQGKATLDILGVEKGIEEAVVNMKHE